MLGHFASPPVPLSLTRRIEKVTRAFYRAFDNWREDISYYVVEVYDDALVAYSWMDERYWRLGYTFDEPTRTVTFDAREAWVEVEASWAVLERGAATAAVRALMEGSDDGAMATRTRSLVGQVTRADVRPTIRQSSDGLRSTFWIATDALARDGMVLDPDGLNPDAYLSNPVVLWQHGRDAARGSLPIARCVALLRKDESQADGTMRRGWLATIEWEDDAFSQEVRTKVRSGALSAASLGFLTRATSRTEVSGRQVPLITSAEMTEFSIVAVPADRGAVVVERSSPGDFDARLARLEALLAATREATASAAPDTSTAPDATAPLAAGDAVPDDAPPSAGVRLVPLDVFTARAAEIAREQATRDTQATKRMLGRA